MALFRRPRGGTNQRVVQEILLRLPNELLSGFPLERRHAALSHGLGAVSKPAQEFFDIELSHVYLLAISATG